MIAAILGVGVGLVETERFRALERRYGERLRRRLFTAGEQAYAARKRRGLESLAVRCAAKLAARHALGLATMRWRELEIVRERGEPPTLRFHAGAHRAALARGVARAALTVTHDPELCIATVVLEARASEEPG